MPRDKTDTDYQPPPKEVDFPEKRLNPKSAEWLGDSLIEDVDVTIAYVTVTHFSCQPKVHLKYQEKGECETWVQTECDREFLNDPEDDSSQ